MKISKIYEEEVFFKQVEFQRQPYITWKDFKEAVEAAGVKNLGRWNEIQISIS